ncbi:unnamed protein product [Arctia plantaginis]|uniref:Peptidase S1 domain-containing protein n=1 Tax=Arctia plantaginis TaxID=874455 RepID=A0A8S0Z417_ARCPL|nr:unnamed protein product [Arctia plantaginis]
MTKLILFLATLVFIGLASASPSRINEEKSHVKKHKKHSNSTKLQEPDDLPDEGWDFENKTHVDTRRILFSKRTEKAKRPYMVYLQLTKESAKAHKYRGWLCGGVVVDPHYVLTSAACVEDADRFYIVSGTTKFVDSFDYKNDECVCKHRRRVVWKCIPKNYKFDFQDSIKWSSNDIAIVKVDKAFKFGVTESGCEFGVCPIIYNNISRELEKPGTKGWIAGWGSGNNFREGVYRRQKEVHIPKNAKCLQEAKVCIMDNEQCAKKWAQRFREIITQYMICTKDVMKRLSEVCDKRYANCTDVETRRHDPEDVEISDNSINIDLGRHLRDPNDYTARRSSMQGGFCENDHGGPLIVRHKGVETVVGVISACKIDPKSHSCHGPFLYTSIYRNRQFISCAIHKDVEQNCRRVFRSGITHEEWSVNWDDLEDEESESTKDEVTPKKEKKVKKVIKHESSSSSSESEEEEVTVPTTTTEKPKEEVTIKRSDSDKSSSKKHKKHRSKKHKVRNEEKEPKVKKSEFSAEEEETTTEKAKDPASYESSEDEAVNNPDNE